MSIEAGYYLLRSSLTVSAMTAMARSISWAVVKRPTERRMVPRAHSMGTSMALKTEETFASCEWHADPVDAATSW